MPNPKYKLTTPCPCCNSQVTVESYTDQPPKLEAVPSPVDNSKSVKTSTPPKPTGVAEAMTNIANSGVNILGSDSFAYADKGWAHDWGKWNPVGIYETLEQRRSRLLEEKIADLQRTVGRQSESLTSAHEKIKSLQEAERDCKQMDLHLDKAVRSAHKRISELDKDFEALYKIIKANARAYNTHLDAQHTGSSALRAVLNPESLPSIPTPGDPTEASVRADSIESVARLVAIAGDYETIKNVLEGYFTVKENEVEKWRKMMEIKAAKLNEITALVYPVYEQGNPRRIVPMEVYDGIKQIIERPEIHPATKRSWTHQADYRAS